MTYFSEALHAALRSTQLSQSHLSQQSGLELSQISQYCLGNSLPPVESLNSILEQFELADRLKLIHAFMQDNIPPGLADVVSVQTTNQQVEVRIDPHAVFHIPQDIQSDILELKKENQPA